ncbi:GNAT family N-acetyltransferase [Roseomonas sp. PWR1]|uniref:GNAT family N-acetyltransferase n=1 Tax=Roseomonas nitratireducens TaxID=2820810 RepID=A0ABS4AR02_9PROT|nr:GNAT family N-acetyltransferase [Neoroseomonas nitratireducens]MBP0463786.1 GNAT family N-acetyltransferase [Neoroseomonas nitratireducens]
MIVREAKAGEADEVADLINAINSLDGETPPVPMTGAIVARDLFGPTPRALLLVAADGARLAGFVTGNLIYDAARAAPAMMVLDLYVRPECRRRGAARALMAALAARARSDGAGCLWWGVDQGDDEATAFYNAIGAASEGWFDGRILDGAAYRTLADEAAP